MLSPKQAAFVASYTQHGNGTRAAMDAGYSPKNAAGQASRLLKNAEVQAYIADVRAQVEGDAVMSLQEATERLSRIARAPCDDTAIRAISKLADLLGWAAPAKLAITDSRGHDKERLDPDEVVTLYAEAVARALDAAPPVKLEVSPGQPRPRPKPEPVPGDTEGPEAPRPARVAFAS